jgi:hypothetical protein
MGTFATASVGVHLCGQGYALRLVSESGDDSAGHWHDRGSGAVGDADDLLEHLAVIQPSGRRRLELPPTHTERGGVLIAMLGVLTPTDVSALRRLAQGAAAGYAVVADPSAWVRQDSRERADIHDRVRRTAAELRAHGWRVAVAGPADQIAALWGGLLRPLRSADVAAAPVQEPTP